MTENKTKPVVKVVIYIVMFLVGCGLCIFGSNIYTNSVKDSYIDTKTKVVESMTSTARQAGLSLGEKQHHTTDRATISISAIREISRLEVLRAGDVEYVIDEAGGIDAWLSIPGNGVYTVDMQRAEIVTDEINNSVSIRVPKPELTNFTIDYENVEKIHFQNNKWVFDSVGEGVEKAEKMLKQGEEMLKSTLSGSFYKENAERSAETMIKSFAYSANPDNTGLKVYIDFFD